MTSDGWAPVPPAPRRAQRPVRLSAQQVRERMLLQGREVIKARGLSAGIDDIRMDELIADANVPRSSVWRIWPSKAAYTADLLAWASDPTGGAVFGPPVDRDTLEAAQSVIAANGDLLRTPEGRRMLLEQTVRISVGENYRTFAVAPGWRSYVALLATVDSIGDDELRTRIAERLHEAERAGFIAGMAAFYAEVTRALGLRLRHPEYTFEHLALVGAAVVEGLALRDSLLSAMPTPGEIGVQPSLEALLHGPLPGPRGTDDGAPWTTAAVGFLGVVDAFTEPDPDFRPPDV